LTHEQRNGKGRYTDGCSGLLFYLARATGCPAIGPDLSDEHIQAYCIAS
jgi:hypothetical protein